MSVNPTGEHIRPWAENKTLTVVNFLGGPGTGKSTIAADVFSLMKRKNFKVEMLREIAKDHVWERANNIFREQDYIFAHQHRLQRRLVGHDIDYCILDSSMLFSLFYTPDDMPASFKTFVRDVYDSYDNINIYLKRNPNIPYISEGRNQDFVQAQQLDRDILQYMLNENIPFHDVQTSEHAGQEILQIIEQHKKVVD